MCRKKQCIEAGNKANQISGLISRSVKRRSTKVIMIKAVFVACQTLFSLCSVALVSKIHEIRLLESVQWSMTKWLQGMSGICMCRDYDSFLQDNLFLILLLSF